MKATHDLICFGVGERRKRVRELHYSARLPFPLTLQTDNMTPNVALVRHKRNLPAAPPTSLKTFLRPLIDWPPEAPQASTGRAFSSSTVLRLAGRIGSSFHGTA
jgi:hypothetical protein